MLKIRPGILVALHTRILGGVEYHRRDLDHEEDGKRESVTWETTRTIEDVDEHLAATKARSDARSTIARVCIATPFGLVCPSNREPDLDTAYRAALDILATFNADAKNCEVRLNMLRGRVAADDAEALAAVRLSISELIDDLERATRAGNVADIRKAASGAKQLEALLEADTDEASKLGAAIKRARKIARTVVKQVEKGGKRLEDVLAALNTAPIALARLAFDATTERQVEDAPDLGGRFATLDTDDDTDDDEPETDTDDDEPAGALAAAPLFAGLEIS